ncbi:ECF-type sigma factor [Pseudoxanthomonas sp.]|uniref:ECF-type sigma factor n=1 Tax=Pseudoxanthomonas sp. TaxID=1871049 RepID=UPI00261A1957|nr:ECF-type sigma factor [Pseudoxanthomonas sp.]WDS37674.1 MAG: ECF-type sigma factor [Pseudoxanthomonas sp.]
MQDDDKEASTTEGYRLRTDSAGEAPVGDLTRLLWKWQQGQDPSAGEHLMSLVYPALRGMAAARMAEASSRDVLLQPTMVMHEAMLRLLGSEVRFHDRAHFFAMAALKMRSVLVDHARATLARKRGGDLVQVTLSQAEMAAAGGAEYHVLALHEALEDFSTIDPRAAKAIEMSYFAGMTQNEIALVADVSVPTVERDLRIARAWLKRRLAEDVD